jgi:hypothetical protein
MQICRINAGPSKWISLKPDIGPGFPLLLPILSAAVAAVPVPVADPAVETVSISGKSAPLPLTAWGLFFCADSQNAFHCVPKS